MPRRRRPFIRESALRDAQLIIIATEDTKATVSYFKTLVSPSYYQNSKVHVEILTREDNASSPEHILRQLDQWCEEYQIAAGDELWLVIDVDRWGEKALSLVARQCAQKGFLLAVSNPAIELWFLLHLEDVEAYNSTLKQELLENAKVNANRTRLEQAILDILGSYNKSNLDSDQFLPHLQEAIERAERLDIRSEDRWPQQLGTRVYLLAQSIIKDSA